MLARVEAQRRRGEDWHAEAAFQRQRFDAARQRQVGIERHPIVEPWPGREAGAKLLPQPARDRMIAAAARKKSAVRGNAALLEVVLEQGLLKSQSGIPRVAVKSKAVVAVNG